MDVELVIKIVADLDTIDQLRDSIIEQDKELGVGLHVNTPSGESFGLNAEIIAGRDHNVIAVKPDCVIPSETKVESFGPFTHDQADAFAVALSEEIKAEWMFYSQSPQADDITPEQAAQFLLNV